jgi:filamentous hemagglutinin family protein
MLGRRDSAADSLSRGAAFAAVLLAAAPVSAGVVTDGSTGPAKTLSGPNYVVGTGLGTRSGNNLFDSFSQFSLAKGESATFTGPSNVTNIVARVTGGTVSTIDGTVATKTGGHPNFYLINPYGVIFGRDGSLNVEGSFHVSTADYLKFSNGAKLLSKLGKGSSFSSAAPAAFGFLAAKPAAITVNGTNLSVRAGRQLEIAGGAVVLKDAMITAPAGMVGIASMAGAGVVPVRPAASPSKRSKFGAIGITGSTVSGDGSSSAAHSGSLYLRGGDITVKNSRVSADNNGPGAGGMIQVAATANLRLLNSASISANTSGAGSAGNVSVSAANILLSDDGKGVSPTGISAASLGGSGNGGQVVVDATDHLTIRTTGPNGAAEISSNTSGNGSGGAVSVFARSLTIAGSGTPYFVGIRADSLADPTGSGTSGADRQASGAAGTVTAKVSNDLNVLNGGEIRSDTYGAGTGGEVSASAANILVSDDGASSNATSISSDSLGGVGDAGNVTVHAQRNLTIRATNPNGAARISSSTYGNGSGRAVSVRAGSLLIDGRGTLYFVGIDAASFADPTASGTPGVDRRASGAAGNVTVNVAKGLKILNGGNVTSDTYGAGAGGTVDVGATTILVSDNGRTFGGSSISSQSLGGSGNAGDVAVDATDSVTIRATNDFGDANIASSTYGDGNGGAISVAASSLMIDGKGTRNFVGINAGSLADPALTGNSGADRMASGAAGNVTINVANGLQVLNGGTVTSDTFGAGAGGKINVSAANILVSDNGVSPGATYISADSLGGSGNAGDVVVNADNSLAIRATNKTGDAYIASSTYGNGNSGAVSVTAGSVVIDGSGTRFFVGIDAASFADPTLSSHSGAHRLASGAAGDVTVNVAEGLRILDGGTLTSDTFGAGAGGKVSVSAANILISDNGLSPGSSYISADSQGGSGRAGDVVVNANDSLIIRATSRKGAAAISSATYGNGRGGSVFVAAKSLDIDGGHSKFTVGIDANSLADTALDGICGSHPSARGHGGSVDIRIADNLRVQDGGQIASSTFGAGNGGHVAVAAGNIVIGGNQVGDGTFISSASRGGMGDAGSIVVKASGYLNILNTSGEGTAAISSFSSGPGDGGDIKLFIGQLRMAGDTSIDASNTGKGDGNSGQIDIQAVGLTLNNRSSISVASSSFGLAGSINIGANTMALYDSGLSTSSLRGKGGGDLAISVADTLLMRNGYISANVIADAPVSGNATISSKVLVLESSAIRANSLSSTGGNIQINAEGFILTADSAIAATGILIENVASQDVTASLAELSGKLASTDQVSHLACGVSGRSALGQSSLVIRGGGALPYDGGEPMPAFYTAPSTLPATAVAPWRAQTLPCRGLSGP